MRVEDGNREQELNSGHKKFLLPYLAGVFVYGLGILLTHYGPFYQSYLSIQAKDTLFFLYLGYLFFAPLFYFSLIGKKQENRPIEFSACHIQPLFTFNPFLKIKLFRN